MLFKMLTKDFKKKKLTNLILFIFMLSAGILIASSSNLLYSTITAVNFFMEKSKVADVISIMPFRQESSDTISKWTEKNRIVKEATSEKVITINQKNVISSNGNELKNINYLTIMPKPKKFNLVFDGEGNEFRIDASEAAIPVSIQRKMQLSIGDQISLNISEHQYKFTVAYIFKDAAFGADLMPMKRILISDQDFEKIYQLTNSKEHYTLWELSKNPGYSENSLEKEFSDISNSTDILTKSYIGSVYVMNMIMAVIMVIIGIFLLLISFFILRFIIAFTVMEDSKQIGIMRAIGIKNSKIIAMYNMKYLALSVIAGFIGLIASFPVADILKREIACYILMKHSPIIIAAAFASVMIEIGITILFCNLCTRKIKKVSIIDAIRQKNSRERIQKSGKLKLNHMNRMKVPLFLAYNDIISDYKKFIILSIIFILGTAIVIIPNNVITTLGSNKTITICGFSNSDFYMTEDFPGDQQDAKDWINKYESKFLKEGIQTKLKADFVATGMIYPADKSERVDILIFQGIGTSADQYEYLKGTAPKLENEIAVTEKVAEALGIHIGDTVICDMLGEKKNFIVTALYQSINNIGKSIRLAESYSTVGDDRASINISGDFVGNVKDKKAQLLKLKKEFSELNLVTGKEFIHSYLGNLTDQIKVIKNIIFALVIGINFLAISLLLRMIISKEIPEIAILKSQGFRTFSIKRWQFYRMGIVLAVSIILGTILANTTGNILTAGVFRMMGLTSLHLMIEPLEVYLIYPLLIFIIAMLAVAFSLGQISRTHVWEINKQE